SIGAVGFVVVVLGNFFSAHGRPRLFLSRGGVLFFVPCPVPAPAFADVQGRRLCSRHSISVPVLRVVSAQLGRTPGRHIFRPGAAHALFPVPDTGVHHACEHDRSTSI